MWDVFLICFESLHLPMLCGLGGIEFVSSPVCCVFMYLLSFVMAAELVLHENKCICVCLLSCALAVDFVNTLHT